MLFLKPFLWVIGNLRDNGTEVWNLVVTATDNRVPEKTGTALVTINVNYNDFAPVIDNGIGNMIQGFISENADIGTSVATVRASDVDVQEDGEGRIVYELRDEGNGLGYFRLLPNGQINLDRSLNMSQRNVFTYTLYVDAYDIRYPEDRTTASVTVDVNRNLNGPIFSNQNPYDINIDETTGPYVSIGQVVSTDADVLDRDKITYTLETFSPYFEVDSTSGVVRTTGDLLNDLTRQSLYTIVVVASDNFVPNARDNRLTVNIRVTRDISTSFTGSTLRLTVLETSPINTTLTVGQKVEAVDPDLQDNFITYEITGRPLAEHYFGIEREPNTNRLDIYVREDLKIGDRTRTEYQLQIRAYDALRSRNVATTTVFITVLRNQNSPVWSFTLPSVNIREDLEPGSPVTVANATDADNDVITYNIVDETVTFERALQQGPSEYFYIDDETGEITLAKSILGLGIDNFELTIRACDDGVPQRCINQPLIINVITDHEPPRFTQDPFEFTINDTAPVDFLIGTIVTVDTVPLGPTQYTLVSPYERFFRIDNSTGQLFIGESLLDDLKIVYNFQVRAVDLGEPAYPGIGNVQVNVIRNPSGPQFLQNPYARTVHETYKIGDVLFNTTAVDLDGDELRYSIINSGPQNYANYFWIDETTGVIYLGESLTGAPALTLEVLVVASDQRKVNEKQAFANVRLDIDADEAPTFVSNTIVPNLAETSQGGQVVKTVTAIDPDQEGMLVYELVGQGVADHMFSVNRTTGEITLDRNIRGSGLDSVNQYVLEIEAYDDKYPEVRATQILIVNINVNPGVPFFTPDNTYEFSVNETRGVFYEVGRLQAQDNDNDPLTYELVTSTDDATTYFVLDSQSGAILIQKDLKMARNDSYRLTVRVSDGRGNNAQATVDIIILRNPDDRPPIFTNLQFDGVYRRTIVYNSVSPGNTMFTATAFDSDQLGTLTFSLTGETSALEFFNITATGGDIILRRPLSEDTFNTLTYRLFLSVYDSARPNQVAKTTLFLAVIRNPSPPSFASGTVDVTVIENVGIGYNVYTVSASDNDGDTIVYYLDSSSQNATDFFSLNQRLGTVTVMMDLVESKPFGDRYSFVIMANDQGIPPRTATLNLNINVDRDRNLPVFTDTYNITIVETRPVDDTILTVNAVDQDVRSSLMYRAVGDGNALAYFKIDSTSGQVMVNKDLMLTRDTYFRLEVEVYDTFFPRNTVSTFVHIYVTRNPSGPVFINPQQYFTTVGEYQREAVTILTVTARDSDGSQVTYNIVNSPLAEEYFYVHPVTGELSVIKLLAENQNNNSYVFTVRASDGRRYFEKFADATVTVNVLRDTLPFFTNLSPGQTVGVNEIAAVNDPVFQVQASDSDLLPGSQLIYNIVGDGLASSFFKIDRLSGAITVANSLFGYRDLSYDVRIRIFDSQLIDRFTEGTLIVVVTRNANDPRFLENPYRRSVDWRLTPGSSVVNVTAVDDDGHDVTYTIVGDTMVMDTFYINPLTGEISLKKMLPPSNPQIIFTVEAKDGANPERTGSATVIIDVSIDESDPVFVRPPGNNVLNIVVDENRAIGYVLDFVSATDNDVRGMIVYETMGQEPADWLFQVNRTTGEIYVNSNLRENSRTITEFTLFVKAYDSDVPDNFVVKEVRITVIRNSGNPSFQPQSEYNLFLDEFYDITVPVVDLNASDPQNDKLTYMIVAANIGPIVNLDDFIYVESSSGILWLKQSLENVPDNSFTFDVIATDDGIPPKAGQARVTINIVRVGLPTLDPEPLITISESIAVGTEFVKIQGRHPVAGRDGDLVYELVGYPPSIYYFNITRDDGDIGVQRSIKDDKLIFYDLRVKTYDPSTPTRVAYGDYRVRVLRNTNTPVFRPDPNGFTVTIYDDERVSKSVLKVYADDLDGDQISFSLEGNVACNNTFRLDSLTDNTANLVLNTDLRATSDSQYFCLIRANDNGYPDINTADVTVTVNVVREQAPTITPTNFERRINEDVLPGLDIITLSADKQGVDPSQLVFELVGDYPSQNFFNVSRTTGLIELKQDLRLDALRNTVYILKVVAYDVDRDELRTTSTVTVLVTRNLNGPRVVPDSVIINVDHDAPVNQWAYEVNVTDPDSTDLRCSIIGNAKAIEYFKISPESCVIKLNKSLADDPDRTTEYPIKVQVSDGEGRIATGDVIVRVQRDLFNPTLNLPNTAGLNEDAAVGTQVFTVQATDADQLGQMMYYIIGEFPGNTFFVINETTGVVTTRYTPKSDNLETEVYTLIVESYDSAWPDNKVTGTLTVTIVRNPSKPAFFPNNFYTRTINADFKVGDPLFFLTANDPDNDALKFINGAPPEYDDIFYVSNDGVIFLMEDQSDITEQTTYSFQVSVTDGRKTNEGTADASIQVIVNPLLGPPRFTETNYVRQIPITQAVNSTILRVEATDFDIRGVVEYKLGGTELGMEYFFMDINGNIYVKTSLVNENRQYLLFVEAYDSELADDKSMATVLIIILPNLNTPRFENDQTTYFASIKDYDPTGTFVIQLNATDADLTPYESQIEFSLVSGNNYLDYFRVDPRSGVISITNKVSLDPAEPDSYVLYVVASDRTPNQAQVRASTATITVSVERNVAPTILDKSSYFRTVSEAVNTDHVVMTIEAIDSNPPDSANGMLTYEIIGPEALKYFRINDSGIIQPRISLRDLTQLIWTFTVRVSDMGDPMLSDEVSVTITIQPVGAPRFIPDRLTLNQDENTLVDAVLTTLNVDDPNPEGRLIFVIRGDGLAKDYFKVDQNGVIRLNRSFIEDDNKTPYYNLRVQAYREVDPNVYAEILITVNVNRNPNAPIFQHGNLVFNISENQDTKITFGSVSATDIDEGTNGEVRYEIATSNLNPPYLQEYFTVNEFNGKLFVIQPLQNDPQVVQYQMTIIARDRGVPSRQSQIRVTVYVTRNPNPPTFIGTPYVANVSENAIIGTSVITVAAQDDDNDPVRFALDDSQQGSLFFDINSVSGLITTKAVLYTQQVSYYEFNVLAYDVSTASRTSTINVRVNIIRNPSGPVFVQPSISVNISEYVGVRTSITTVQATDADNPQSLSGQLRYAIQSADPSIGTTYFVVSEVTGEITVASQLTHTTPAPRDVSLTVIAYDRSNEPKTATATVNVYIERNNFAPLFEQDFYEFITYNTDPQGLILGTVSAFDNDVNVELNRDTPNARFDYVIDSSEYERFFTVRTTGDFALKQSVILPSSEIKAFNVSIIARDRSWQSKSSRATIQITLETFIGPEPILGFIQPVWRLEVIENLPINTTIEILNAVNQEGFVGCDILSGNVQPLTGPVFTLTPDEYNKNCRLAVANQIDFEKKQSYVLTISVTPRANRKRRETGARKKRQTRVDGIYNAFPTATVYIEVVDANDNIPVWQIPLYPEQERATQNTYFGLVDRYAYLATNIISVYATDIDSGDLGRVQYVRNNQEDDFPNANAPFAVGLDSGEIINTVEMEPYTIPTYKFQVKAQDNPGRPNDQLSSTADVIVHTVDDHQRFILLVQGNPSSNLPDVEAIRQFIQSRTGYIVLIDQIRDARVSPDGFEVSVNRGMTDIVFALADPLNPQEYFPLMNSSDPRVQSLFNGELEVRIQEELNIPVDDVHIPYGGQLQRETVLTKSYIWWTDDPWAPLIAIVAISILLAFVGIVVIIFTHSRYIKYINNYRLYQQTYHAPDFVEPPSFLREYETQSLNMFVPPDEATGGAAEVQMSFSAEGISAVEVRDEGEINPVYVVDDPQPMTTTSYVADTTLL